jgi:RNA polymerase sigma-70 factor (ECF subfamily)
MQDLSRPADVSKGSASRAQLDEFELVRRAQLGSSAAFDELVVRRGPDLYRYLLVRLRNESDARDALQEAMTDAWRGLPGLRRADRFWPWLVAIAARKGASVVRDRGETTELDAALPASDDPGLLEIWDAVGRLPARYRDVLILRYRLELTEEETAEALRIRVGTVKSRCARGRKALMELLS